MIVEVPARSALSDIEELFEEPRRFLRYLEDSPEGLCVGLRCNAFNCPLGEYIKKMLGYYAVEVTGTEILVWLSPPATDTPGVVYPMDVWATNFVESIDGEDTKRAVVSKIEAEKAMHKVLYYMGDTTAYGA